MKRYTALDRMSAMGRLLPMCMAFGLLVGACSDSATVLTAQRQISPDSKLVATVEAMDNGLGFGQGRMYYEVHISPSGEQAGSHGDHEPSVVFWTEVLNERARPVTAKWVSQDKVRITYDLWTKPGKQLHSRHGGEIEYQEEAQR